jgi:SNF2 family DNA or RNA helicase
VVPVSGVVYGTLSADGTKLLVQCTGSEWDMKDTSDRLMTVTPAVEPETDPATQHQTGRLQMPLSWAAVCQLSTLFPAPQPGYEDRALTWVPAPEVSQWIVAETVRRGCQGDFHGMMPSNGITPMPHQVGGAVAIGMNGRFLPVDDMGTGKTGTAMLGLAELDARGRNPWPALVVCPASVIDSWLEEVETWYPTWAAVAWRGPKRLRLLKTAGINLYVTSYETMRNDVGTADKPGPLRKLKVQALILDEAHKICGYDSLQSRSARSLAKKVPNVIEMTGTPSTGKILSFWPLLNAMYPSSFPSRDRFKDRYCLRGFTTYGSDDLGGLEPSREPEFRAVMQGTMRRVALTDVVKDMPPKTYQTRYIEMPAKYRKAYDAFEEDMLAELPDVTTPLEANSVLAKMMRLAQLAHSACDVQVTEEVDMRKTSLTYGEVIEKLQVTPMLPSWKADALVELLEEYHEADGNPGTRDYVRGSRPVLAFAPLKQLVMLSGQLAASKGWAVDYIVGGMDNNARTAARHKFQDRQLDLLCVTTGAGGSGLTLTAAHCMAFLMRPWPLVEALQAEGRGFRKGLDHPIQVVDFVTKDTIESRIRSALRDKAHNLSELVEDPRIVRELFGGMDKKEK